MIEAFKNMLQIAGKDLLDFFRNRMELVAFIIMPIFMMVMTGYIFPSGTSLKNIALGVVENDKGEISQNIVTVLEDMKLGEKNDNIFLLERQPGNLEGAKEELKKGNLNAILIIPEGFSSDIKESRQGILTLIIDQSNPQISSILTGMMEKIVDGLASKVAIEKLVGMMATELPTDKPAPSGSTIAPSLQSEPNPQALVKPFVIKTEGLVPGEQNYFQFMAPGIIAMVVVMAVMIGLATSISREKELGTLDGILVAPISRLCIILGKALSQTTRGLLQGSIVLLLSIFLFGVKIYGSIPLVALLLFLGLGILISAIAAEQETAMMIMMTLTFPMIFLSGVFFPIEQMPGFMQIISRILPLTYAIEALRKVIILGAGISSLGKELTILITFGAITLAVAVPAFKRIITR
ncbi:putative multidrug ABC transporter permease YbhR [subsurface metagenome]